LIPAASITLRRPARPARDVIVERWHWGRIFGAARRRSLPFVNILGYAVAAPILPAVLSARIVRLAMARPVHARRLPRAIPALVVLSLVWCAGELAGELTGRP
jgi:hypothetical protein